MIVCCVAACSSSPVRSSFGSRSPVIRFPSYGHSEGNVMPSASHVTRAAAHCSRSAAVKLRAIVCRDAKDDARLTERTLGAKAVSWSKGKDRAAPSGGEPDGRMAPDPPPRDIRPAFG